MRFYFVWILLSSFIQVSCQHQDTKGLVKNPAFDKTLTSLLSFDVPVKSVLELKNNSSFTLLDAREQDEYDTSHIPGAIHIGYDHWDEQVLQKISKDQPIVLYCSVGYRSEKIGKKLIKRGYTKVYNLYGSIFEWANEGLPLIDKLNKPTNKLHTYNKNWSQWVTNDNIIKSW